MSIRCGCTVLLVAEEPIADLLRQHTGCIHSAHIGSSVTKNSVKSKMPLNKNVALRSRHSLCSWMHRGITPPKVGHAEYTEVPVNTLYSMYIYIECPTLNIHVIIISLKSLTYFSTALHICSSILRVSLDVRGGYKLQRSRWPGSVCRRLRQWDWWTSRSHSFTMGIVQFP